MTRKEVVRQVAKRIKGVTQDDVASVLSVYQDVIFEALKNDPEDRVPLWKMGSFKLKTIKAKSGKSYLTGNNWSLPERKELYFKKYESSGDFE